MTWLCKIRSGIGSAVVDLKQISATICIIAPANLPGGNVFMDEQRLNIQLLQVFLQQPGGVSMPNSNET
jgi:hypothetical protein